MKIQAKIQWVIPELGGRKIIPNGEFRASIRFLKHIDEYLKGITDVVITRGSGNLESLVETVVISTNEDKLLPMIKDGELFELLDSYNVIAIGKIEDASIQSRKLK